MSELKVNKVSPATGTAITLGDSGDTFTVPSGAPIVNSGTATGFGGGKVLQVVSTTMTASFTTTASSPTQISGLSCAITPSATSSKVLIMVDVGCLALPASYFGSVELRRGTSTAICIGDQVGSNRPQRTGPIAAPDIGSRYFSMNFLDSPSTTSATTYYLYGYCESSGKLSINQLDGDYDHAIQGARGASTMTLMEIGV